MAPAKRHRVISHGFLLKEQNDRAGEEKSRNRMLRISAGDDCTHMPKNTVPTLHHNHSKHTLKGANGDDDNQASQFIF
jgi:hypothetical protein